MSNTEICKWAWQKSRTNRWPLWSGQVVSMVPTLLGAVVILVMGWSATGFYWWTLPLQWVGQFLGLGVLFIAFELALERESDLTRMGAVFQRERLKKAMAVALFFVLLSALLGWYPTHLAEKGQGIMTAANDRISALLAQDNYNGLTKLLQEYESGETLYSVGQFLNGTVSILIGTLLFPVGYFLFFREEMTVGAMLKEGGKLLIHSFGQMLGMAVRCFAVLPAGIILILLIARTFWAVIFLLVLVAFWLPWEMLAWARLTVELAERGPEDPWWAKT